MQNPIRTMVLGLLLACGPMAVHAKTKAPTPAPPVPPATSQPSPLDLALAPSASLPSATGFPLAPPATQPSTSLGLASRPAVMPPSTSPGLATRPAALPPSSPDLSIPPARTPQSGQPDVLQSASAEVRSVARWVAASGDNGGLPYLVIDKVNAQVFAFTPAGLLQGAAPALLGMGRGDHMLVPNDTKMSAMPPPVRITPAGRFVSRLAIDSHGKELLVLDYDASFSLHAVVKGTPAEHRAERLNSPSVQDNRISFGCINVPTSFYSTVVSPAFTGKRGIVYVLPETAPASQVFGFQAADAQAVSSGTATLPPAGLNARSAPAPSQDAGQPRLAQ